MKQLNNYFLGVVCGDGELIKSGKEVRWTTTDREWFDELGELLKGKPSFYKVKGRVDKEVCLLRIGDEDLVKWMVSRGIAPGKSRKDLLVLPEEGYEWDFVRGLMESDGSVYHGVRNTGESYGAAEVLSRGPQNDWLGEFFLREGIVSSTGEEVCRGTKTRGLFNRVVSYPRSLREMYSKVYKGPLCLERKKRKFEELLRVKTGGTSVEEVLELMKGNESFRTGMLRDLVREPAAVVCRNWGISYGSFRRLKNEIEKLLGIPHSRGLRGALRSFL